MSEARWADAVDALFASTTKRPTSLRPFASAVMTSSPLVISCLSV